LPIKKVVKKFDFPKKELINLILDINNYKDFLPWCKNSIVTDDREENTKRIIFADLEIGYKQIADTYTSEVIFDRENSQIIVKPVSGPIKKLTNIWKFKEITEKSCEVNFYIEIELNNFILNTVFEKFFDAGFEKIFTSFENQAKKVLD
jgi:coenzyme Q-binding protein COQ10